MPCHGDDINGKADTGLSGWRKRLEKGEAFVTAFTAKAKAVLDYLIKERYTDPRSVAVCGTSRGGFIALHFAAADPRIRCTMAFAPVTELLALLEFKGMEKHTATQQLAAIHLAGKLAGRPIWLCIGNNDGRVGTDHAIAFTRAVVKKATALKIRPIQIDLHVMSVAGHRIHATAHDEAAAWILKQINAVK
jgi:dienelactone hydrolase